METCYLKRFCYYTDRCPNCNAMPENNCFQSKLDVEEHLQHLNRLFAESLETSPVYTKKETFDDMFEIHKGGFL